ncbi:MAG: AMP-binding protein [Actinobacteria bacterium]|nr:AMP-binding protein [Actinomycetota bacterium]
MTAEVLTADEAERRQGQLAGALARRGVLRRIAVLTSDGALTADRLCLIAAALRIGVAPVVLHAALTPSERYALLANAEADLVVDDRVLAELVADHGRSGELAPAPLCRPMLYTSGTTGEPKAVWSGLLNEADATALVSEEQALWGFNAQDRHLVCGNAHHSAPLRFSLGTLLAGGSVVLPGKFDAGTQLAAVKECAPTSSFMAPAHLHRLLDLASDDPNAFASFRLIAHAGAPTSEAVKRRAIGAFPGGSVWEFYGATEGQFTACSPEEWLERPGTLGRARPGRTMTADEDGTLWCAPPTHGRFVYWNDQAKTAAAWRGDAFTVFDLGRIDADGYVYLDGRRDDLILSGGVNVYPAEIERVLLETAGVTDAAVFPRPDESWGQRVCAAYVGEAGSDAVTKALRAALAGYKQPKELHCVAEIPRSPNGKVRRSALAGELGLD